MKILKIKEKHFMFPDSDCRRLKYVMEARFVKNKYTHVLYKGVVFQAKASSEGCVFVNKVPFKS